MDIDLYAPCRCGSGKTVKWCCQTYYQSFDKAIQLFQAKQTDAAIRVMEQLVQSVPNDPKAILYQAEFYFRIGQLEPADEALQRAFKIQPDLPLGHWIRSAIRMNEGEQIGSLIELRKAAELYDPKCKLALSEIYLNVSQIEFDLNRPIAGFSALDNAIRYDSTSPELRQAAENLAERFPPAAVKRYSLRTPKEPHAQVWQQIVAETEPSSRLRPLANTAQKLLEVEANDPAIWFNLGLVQAWLGENQAALEALRKAIDISEDEPLCKEAAELCEVLSFGANLEVSDHRDYCCAYPIQDVRRSQEILNGLIQAKIIINLSKEEDQEIYSGLFTDWIYRTGGSLDAPPLSGVLATIAILPDRIILRSGTEERAVNAASFLEQQLGDALQKASNVCLPANFSTFMMHALPYGVKHMPPREFLLEARKYSTSYFEEGWLGTTLFSLGGMTPPDATHHPLLRKRLNGIIGFIEGAYTQASKPLVDAQTEKEPVYDFNRLRLKLGLIEPSALQTQDSIPFDTLSVAGLAALPTAGWEFSQYSLAFREARKLGANELAEKFALLALEPAVRTGEDRFPFYAFLTQLAVEAKEYPKALQFLEQGEADDTQANSANHRHEFRLRRAQILTKAGQIPPAVELFGELLREEPHNLKLHAIAAESMLGQGEADRALIYAEAGLTESRSQNHSDSERHFLELVSAANKLKK